MFPILQKEFNAFLNSLIAYLVIGVFLLGTGLFMWVFPDTSILESGFSDMETLFNLGPYLFMFLIPAITMRSFAEEKKAGTMELLFTKPVSDAAIILGKYFAGVLLVLFALIPTLIYYYSVHQLGSPEGNLDAAGISGSYIGLFLLAAVFTSAGIFSSAVTDNQIVSFILAIVLCFVCYTGFGSLSNLAFWGVNQDFVASLGIEYHYAAVSKGLIDSRDILYFLSLISILLFSTHLVLGSRKW